MYLPLVEIGGKLGPAERAAQARRMASKLARERLTAAKSAWAAGADAPAEIAEMVMPNVRPIPINRADCGPSNEIDLADGEEKREDLLRGTKFAGSDYLPERIWRELKHEGRTLGVTCNAEIRRRFSDKLRRRLTAQQLRDSFLFLSARRAEGDGKHVPVTRLAAFQGRTRRPPLRWLNFEVEQWTRRHPSGRALERTLHEFWREDAATSDDVKAACPAAAERWASEQARFVALIENRLTKQRAAAKAEAPR